MKNEPGVQAESQQGPVGKQNLKARDIIGIVMGVPILLAGLWFAYSVLHGNLYQGLVGAILLFISTSLFIPSRLYELYEHERTRAIGLVALSLVIAVSVNCAFFVGFSLLAGPNDGALLALVVAATFLIAFVFVLLCTLVLLGKLRPKPAHKAIAITAGIAVGLLHVLPVYLVYLRE
jgi:hypothetical protein